jgi:thrombospondin 2/3/4/5
VNSIGDACEFDSDKDGIPDGSDNAIHQSNPGQEDRDRDRIGDIIDNCSLYNPDQLDLDKNGK